MTPRTFESCAHAFLPQSPFWCEADDRIYRLHHVTGDRERSQEFRGLDGELFVGVRQFRTEAEAVLWVERDLGNS